MPVLRFLFAQNELLRWLTLPWIPILVALALAGAVVIRQRFAPQRFLLLLTAGAYYGGFFLVTPGLHYRYFLPAHVLLLIAIVASTHALTRRAATQTTDT